MSEKIFERAVDFATKAHDGQTRKVSGTPYILHPLEVAEIAKTMTDDEDVWAAAVLHDVVEDTDRTMEDIEKLFGAKVAKIVAGDTEDKRSEISAEATWKIRKQETIDYLVNDATAEEKIIVLSDKLSNIRQLAESYKEIGDELWSHFNQKDKSQHAWYYREILNNTAEFSEYAAWQEYKALVDEVFSE